MADRDGRITFFFCTFLAICGCSKPAVQNSPVSNSPGGSSGVNPTIDEALDFLAGNYKQVFTVAMGDIYSNGTIEPLGAKNDGFGTLTSDTPPGLESLTSSLQPRSAHSGRINRDTRLADFDNDGFLDVVSNTYDCIDPLNPNDVAKLYKNNGDGTFTEALNPFRDSSGHPLTIQGRSETIVVADFNNDGFLDIFIPYYSYLSTDPDPDGPPGSICENSKQSYLLINDGAGHFTDVADAAGVSLRNLSPPVEGAQALDFNDDGLIDLQAGNHLFTNTGITNGIPHFVEQSKMLGLPPVFSEEGVKYIDAYNDGFLDLVLLNPNTGPSLLKFDGSTFVEQPVAFPPESYGETFGLNAYDINNDGLEDVLITGGTACDPKIFLNTGSGFARVSPRPRPLTLDKSGDSGDPFDDFCLTNGAMAFADLDNNGKIDIIWPAATNVLVFDNNSQSKGTVFTVELLGPNGEHNQQGRVVRMSPQSRPDVTFTRVVDSGSGYLSQNQYPLLIASPYEEPHVVTVSLPEPHFVTVPLSQSSNSNKVVTISFTISPRQRARIFAPSLTNANGRVELTPLRPFIFDPALYPAAQGILE